MTRPAQLVRDPSALRHNYRVACERASGARVYGILKADAYGNGASWAAEHLLAEGAPGFGVATLEEAVELIDVGVDVPVLLLEGAVDGLELAKSVSLGCELVIHSPQQLTDLIALGTPYRADVWLKIDTGMGRLGFSPEQAAQAWRQIERAVEPGRLGLMTHFANADNPDAGTTELQIRALYEVADTVGAKRVSLANSAGLLGDWSCHREDFQSLARPGIMLYGISPHRACTAASLGLRPVATFRSSLISVKPLPAGAGVGYGSKWIAKRDSNVGIVAAGYADGFPRHIAPGTQVLVRDTHVPIIGTVSMDMLAVDLTDVNSPARGDEVVLWGERNPIEHVAERAGTIGYELACRVSKRVYRVDVA